MRKRLGRNPVRWGPGRRTRVNRRKRVETDLDGVKTGVVGGSWEEPGGNPLAVQAASGIEAA